jgi:arylsulfatase A-like enzyme
MGIRRALSILLPLALAAAVLLWWRGGVRPPRPPNVVLITIESLRPDHLGAYGGPRPTMPQLDALAADAVVYEHAHSVTSWTLAAHASLFTGLYPRAHQAEGPLDTLGDAYTTLAEILRDHGYQTAGVASGPYLRREFKLTQGFEYYDDAPAALDDRTAHGDVTNPRLLAAIARFLRDARDPRRPLFLFAYFWDPHYDYIPPPPYDGLFVGPESVPADVTNYVVSTAVSASSPPGQLDYVRAQYDGELRWTDDYLGRLFALLREHGLWDDTIVVVTSDHGEEFFEHGAKGHKNNLFVESVRVPLVVKYEAARRRRGRDPRLASLVDVLPTILEVTGIAAPGPLNGHSLLEPDPPPDRPIFFELLSMWFDREQQETTRKRLTAVQRGSLKLIEVSLDGAPAPTRLLFDHAADPVERSDLLDGGSSPQAEELGARLAEWQGEMARLRERFEPGGTIPLTREQREQLRALGYLGE